MVRADVCYTLNDSGWWCTRVQDFVGSLNAEREYNFYWKEIRMDQPLRGKKIAFVVEDGFEQVELTEPKKAVEQAGAEAEIVSPKSDKVSGWNHTEWGAQFRVDVPLEKADPNDYDAVVLPGGVMNPDRLRRNQQALRFVGAFAEAGKPMAAICHGPWTLIDAGVAKGRRLTSYESLQTDLKNAGAEWVDEEVVVDKNLVTSRKPSDIPAFNKKIVEVFTKNQF
jgi:protease I